MEVINKNIKLSVTNHPIFVVLISDGCAPCSHMKKIWDDVVKSVLKVYPKLRFPPSNIDTKTYKYPPIKVDDQYKVDSNIFPKDLNIYSIAWRPNILLIPGDRWDYAMQTLGPTNDRKLSNVQVMMEKKSLDYYLYLILKNLLEVDLILC